MEGLLLTSRSDCPIGLLDPEEALQFLDAIGGKAAGLARLTAAGLNVPPWRVLPGPAVAEWLTENDQLLHSRLVPWLDLWSKPPFAGIAIRSSSPQEDSRRESHAGQFDTEFVDDPSRLVSAFRKVATSSKIEISSTAIPVILQALVPSAWSGVAFSADPSAALPRTACIEYVEGYGSTLVSGGSTPERLHLDLASTPALDIGAIPASRFIPSLLAAESALDCAVDVEWTISYGQLWILQARPITVLSLAPSLLPPEPMTSWFFDQRFPDPITPFTQDTLLPIVADVALGDALRMRGENVPTPLVQFIGGRAYAPLSAYTAMLRGAPRWWLSPDLRAIFRERNGHAFKVVDFLDYVRCSATTVWRDRRDVIFNVRAWEAFAADLPEALASIPTDAEGSEGFVAAWESGDALSRRYLEIHRWSILWADYGYRVLSWLQRILPFGWGGRLHAAVHAAAPTPTRRANEALRLLRAGATDDERKQLLAEFGDRSGSLDYAVPTWSEIYGGPFADYEPPKKSRRLWVRPLALLARLLQLREEQRCTWEHILARQRRLAMSVATRLVIQNRLASTDDIWLLRRQEVQDLLDGVSTLEPHELALRRHELQVFAAAFYAEVLHPERAILIPPSKGNSYQGVGASPGIVEGIAELILDPGGAPPLPGRILVLRALDPACSGIMRDAAGLVVERGGILSHAAILAREYRIPLVVDVPGIARVIRSGDPITLDGSRGWVTMKRGEDSLRGRGRRVDMSAENAYK